MESQPNDEIDEGPDDIARALARAVDDAAKMDESGIAIQQDRQLIAK